MNRFDGWRRAASISVVAASLLVVPGIATATFSGRGTGGLAVTTDRMETPAAVTGTFTCNAHANQEGVRVDVTGFTDTGPAGSTFAYALLVGGAVQATASTASHAQSLGPSMADDKAATVWTLRIQSVRGSWTGAASTTAISCTRKSDNSGTL